MIDLKKVRALIESTALKNGFKLKQQPNGEMALNPYVFDFAEELLANKQAEITELKQRLEKLESGEWISVKDRLPKIRERVILFDSNGLGSLSGRLGHIRWYLEGDIDLKANITHWQPLQKAPKGYIGDSANVNKEITELAEEESK